MFPASCSSGDQLAGTFLDAPVSGLTYAATPSGLSGTTDTLGTFKFKAGDSVAFSVLGVGMGSAKPVTRSDGTTIVTPLSLTGESLANSPNALAIARLLNSLNSISVNHSAGAPGVMVMPTDSALATALDALATPAAAITRTMLQTVIDGVYGAGSTTVPSDSDSQAALAQAAAATGVAGAVWRADCPGCGGGILYFGPDGRMYGFTDDGATISGTWTGSGSSINVYALASSGGTASGSLAAGATTGTLLLAGNSKAGTTLFLSQLTGAAAPGSTYSGLWFATFTPNAAGVQANMRAGSAYVILSPDGNVYGMTGDANRLSGSWNTSTGLGTATIAGDTVSLSFDLATGSGTGASGATVLGALSFSRTGVVSVQSGSDKANLLSMNVPLFVTWPSPRSFALDFSISDASGTRIANTVVGEVTTVFLQNGGATNMTDEMSLSYPQGAGKTYQFIFGNGTTTQDGCTIVNGAGTVVDGYAFLPGAYPTVQVTCTGT